MFRSKYSKYRDSDKNIEKQRYDLYAESIIFTEHAGAQGIDEAIRSPYIFYHDLLRAHISSDMQVLEMGSGAGMHTNSLALSGASVVALDISEHSLRLLKSVFHSSNGNIEVVVGDIECLPIQKNSVDVVCGAGMLSYGDGGAVMSEIHRVLKPGGLFICVDSLNDNFIYRFNRWLHYVRGNRTRSTLLRMPSIQALKEYELLFDDVSIFFFGGLAFLTPLLSPIIGRTRMAAFSDWFDIKFKIKRLAFKFVMISKKAI